MAFVAYPLTLLFHQTKIICCINQYLNCQIKIFPLFDWIFYKEYFLLQVLNNCTNSMSTSRNLCRVEMCLYLVLVSLKRPKSVTLFPGYFLFRLNPVVRKDTCFLISPSVSPSYFIMLPQCISSCSSLIALNNFVSVFLSLFSL